MSFRHTRKKGQFWPRKYYSGLTRKQKTARQKEIRRFGAMSWKNQQAYRGFKTNKYGKHRSSKYTLAWRSKFPEALRLRSSLSAKPHFVKGEARSLEERAAVSGVPVRFLRESYNRGVAAWRTGHRPGASKEQWGYARVASFLMCGKTHWTADADIVRRAKAASASARKWWQEQCGEWSWKQ